MLFAVDPLCVVGLLCLHSTHRWRLCRHDLTCLDMTAVSTIRCGKVCRLLVQPCVNPLFTEEPLISEISCCCCSCCILEKNGKWLRMSAAKPPHYSFNCGLKRREGCTLEKSASPHQIAGQWWEMTAFTTLLLLNYGSSSEMRLNSSSYVLCWIEGTWF